MKKIALINPLDFHYEIIGGLCEIYKNYEISLFQNMNRKKDKYEYIKFFELLFNIKIHKKDINDIKKNQNNYEKIFVITMTHMDYNLIEYNDNVYGFIHSFNRRNPYINNIITLFPNAITGAKQNILDKHNKINYNSFFPLYNYPNFNVNFNEKNKILSIGIIYKEDFINIEKLNNNSNLEVIILKGRKCKLDKSCFNMVELLKKTKFILAKQTYIYPLSYTGSVTISLSFNIPLILIKKKADEYNIPCITFENNISEIIDKLNNMDENEYNKICNDIEKFRNNQIQINRKTFL